MDPPARTAASTPASSPGLFSHPSFIGNQRSPANVTPEPAPQCSPYLHPLQMHRPVKETHKAQVEQDFVTGRKLINQYEIIDEIGRGVHGKVKLARNLETDVFVAIKIIQRFSKKRRLGRVTVSPEDKTKREIAILKKIRHPHVVGLLEVIDDPEYKKIYMVLEYVELGEVVWRKKGVRDICVFERQRQESEARGEDTTNDEKFFVLQGRRRLRKEGLQKAKLSQYEHHEPWSLEYGNTEDEPEEEAFDHMATVNAMPTLSRHNTHESIARSAPRSFRSNQGSRATSRAPSLAASQNSSQVFTPMPPDFQIGPGDDENEDVVPASLPGPLSAASSAAALEGSMYGSYVEEPARPMMRHRTPSMADSIISHMSSIDGFVEHDAFEDDYSYVPCFTIDQARSTFRDTVLGLEYLHYEGIVHRDIKPANLLWTKDHRVKISDFGVSYFGRPIRDGENEEQVSETDAEDFDDDLELAKTVGTPAFFAPELCYTDADIDQPKVNEMIDVWSLGVTLYCLIYARIPFMAEDEFQLFRAIATEPVFIPRRRLRPVDPSYSGSEMNLSKRIGPTTGRYREDAELRMEEIPDDLHDLLSRMLVKDPRRRIKLKDIKLHPWVIQGIDNLPQWIEETDPSRRAQGRRIQVNERELERAVVPLTFLERARSMVKKIGNTIAATTTRSQRGEGSRRRALSSTNSSNGESPHFSGHFSPPAAMREHRRASLRGDEPHLYHAREHHLPSEHPLAQSVTASPEDPAAHLEDPIVQYVLQQQRSPLPTPLRQSSSLTDVESQSPRLDRSGLTATTHTVVHRPSQSLNIPRSEELLEECETVYTPSSADYHGFFTFVNPSRRKSLAGRSSDANLNRSAPQVPEKSLFASNDKHAGASLAISRAVAPGNVEKSVPLRPAKLVLSEVNTPAEIRSPSPHFPPYSATISQPESTLSMALGHDRSHMTSPLTEVRPVTTHGTPEPRTPAPRVWGPSTDESFARAQDQLDRRRQLEIDIQRQQTPPRHTEPKMKDHNIQEEDFAEDVIPPCPVSPDDEIFFHKQQKDRQRKESAISVQSTDIVSPPTTASDVTSPTSSRTLSSSQDQSFASDPSLPALVSGASSVSADADFELLRRSRRGGSPESPVAAHGTPATLTPEMLPKLPEAGGSADDGYPISPGGESFEHEHDDVFGNRREYTSAPVEDYDSDSDEGLTMGRKKPAPTKNFPVRRGTNASVGSNETAKKVPMTE